VAALVFNQLYFPTFAPLTGTLASFATFGVGFFARPVGGVVFGHFGDRAGRKSMLVITLLVMGWATFLIGLLPTFETISILAPILPVVLRFPPGFAVGGEWGGATLMPVEHGPEESRNFYASWPQMGAPAGLVLSSAVFTAFSSLPDEQFFAWGRRMPFLLSIVLIGVELFIRLRVLKSPAFSRVKELGKPSRPTPMHLAVFRADIGASFPTTSGFLARLRASYGMECPAVTRQCPVRSRKNVQGRDRSAGPAERSRPLA